MFKGIIKLTLYTTVFLCVFWGFYCFVLFFVFYFLILKFFHFFTVS